MELGELKVFVTVAAEHSFSRAAIKLAAGRAAASQLTLVYRDNGGQPNAVEDFVEAVRSTGEDRASRKAPIPMRTSR
jgi:DNA-binding transcriptional LysR family regulator